MTLPKRTGNWEKEDITMRSGMVRVEKEKRRGRVW